MSIMNSVTKKWKELSARSQLLLFLFAISFIVLLVSLTILYFINQFQVDSLAVASKKLMLAEIYKQAAMVRIQYKRRSELQLRRGGTSIINLNKLYHRVQRYVINYEQPNDCLTNFTKSDYYQFNSSFCYGIFGDQLTRLDNEFKRFTGVINQMVQLLDQDFTFYYTSTDISQFFSQFKGLQLTNYKPHNRPWYIEHFNKSSSKVVDQSKPYFNWMLNSYVLALITNLKNSNDVIIGLFGSEFQFQMPQITIQIPNNISIIDEDGVIYLSKLKLETVQLFYNVSLTGYDIGDYQQIMNKYKFKNYTDNCTSITTKIRVICRYNKLYNREQFITFTKINYSNLILVVQTDVETDLSTINEQVEDTKKASMRLFYDYIINLVSFCFFIIGMSIITLIAIFGELHKIRDFVNYRLRSQRYVKEIILLRLKQNTSSDNVIDQLESAFMNLTKNIEQNQYLKNPTCINLQKVKNYPKQVQSTRFFGLIKNYKKYFPFLQNQLVNEELEYFQQLTDSGQITFHRRFS